MRRLLLSLGIALMAVVPVLAKRAAPPPVALKVPVVDVIVLGKVTAFGPKLVPADGEKGDGDPMQIAHVEVDETLLGKKMKKIQVGFFPVPGGRSGRVPTMTPQLDVEACWFLTRHPTKKDVYQARNWYDVVNKKDNPEFKPMVEEVRRCVKLLENPTASFRSKDADQRYLTAAMLLTRYRSLRTGTEKQVPIPAEESKQVLAALAEADWTGATPAQSGYMNPLPLFLRLGLTDKDGWKQPAEFNALRAAAKEWLKANADTYRVKRFASESAEPDPEPSR